MAEVEHHFTVLVRLPFKRGDFVDPPPVAWSAAKERELWNVISRPSKGNDINWKALADKFQVSQQFLLQQAAWLYERQLSQVRAQMRRVGSGNSNTPSPVPGSTSGSVLGGQAMRRTGSGGSRGPSRLSIRQRDSPLLGTDSGNLSAQRARAASSRPISANKPLETVAPHQPHSKRTSKESLAEPPSANVPNLPHEPQDRAESSSSPNQSESSSDDTSSGDESNVRTRHQQHRYRRATQQRLQASVHPPRTDDDDEDGSDEPFLPFAGLPKSQPGQDPGATLRADPRTRPTALRRITPERVAASEGPSSSPPSATSPSTQPLSTIESSATSSSSSNTPSSHPHTHHHHHHHHQPPRTTRHHHRPSPLSPRQTAALNAAGLSPLSSRQRPHQHRAEGGGGQTSDGTGTPSMGSSFSDLDDTSVTQSALEEALLSNMQRGGGGNGNGNGGLGVVTSRMSTISQALRSRYL